MPLLSALASQTARLAPSSRGTAPFSFQVLFFSKKAAPTRSGPAAMTSSTRRVANAPGAMAFTSTLKLLSSSAKVSMRRTTAALEAA